MVWESGRLGVWESGGLGVWATGSLVVWESGSLGDWESGSLRNLASSGTSAAQGRCFQAIGESLGEDDGTRGLEALERGVEAEIRAGTRRIPWQVHFYLLYSKTFQEPSRRRHMALSDPVTP